MDATGCRCVIFSFGVAETNGRRSEMVEAESELVAGFAVRYSATPFLCFFLGEYIAIMTCAQAPRSCSSVAAAARSGASHYLGRA